MSEAITLTSGQTVTIYGTFAAGGDYMATMFGPLYTAWRALVPDDQKRSLIVAMRYLEAQTWDPTTAPDFATRDGIPAFAVAEFELAALIADDPTITQEQDQGTNIRSVGAGSARVDFFNPTSAQFGTAPILPPIIMRLVAQYLASAAAFTGGAPDGNAGDCESPFSAAAEYLRLWPY